MPGGDKVFLLCLFPYGSIIEIFYFFRGKAFRVQGEELLISLHKSLVGPVFILI